MYKKSRNLFPRKGNLMAMSSEPTSPDRFSVDATGLLMLVTTTTCVEFRGRSTPSGYGVKEYMTDDHIVTVDEQGNRFMANPKSLNGSSRLRAGTSYGFVVRFFSNENSPGDRYRKCFTLGVWLSFDEQGYLVIAGTNQRVTLHE
ncbi:hypothetical protein [Shimazuella alba]|uniref:Uncharacterized protein n=1 Tax=Shimazuella alba TaxID=2690964 RepID=A0A6I4VX14_9BACL|nr:hypothetical protein [Shimazuella alba]MXQ54406.1 hypothetical protein [Shimazuella alba]